MTLAAWLRALPFLLALGLAPAVILWLVRRYGASSWRPSLRQRRLGVLAILALAMLLGYHAAWDRLALYDDAYISFRYARNFAEGHGLVWNPGERVEGYTNFLWTWSIGWVLRFGPWSAPAVGLTLSLLAFGGCLVVTALLGRRLVGARWLPVAVPLLVFQQVFTDYGSTGLESGFCALLVAAAALALVRADGWKGLCLAGTLGIAATLTRPDHAVFYGVGGLVLLAEEVRRRRDGGARLPALGRLLAYAAPSLVYVGYLAWKLDYYGALVPNTYWAKSAHDTWYLQGLAYAVLFWLGTHAWVAAALALGWWRSRPEDPRQRRFAGFMAGSLLLYGFYVVRVGGDFMHGRFFVSLLPLAAVGAELAVHRLAAHRRWTALAIAAGLLLASTWPVQLFDGRRSTWGIVDENAIFPVTALHPDIEVHSVLYRLGRVFGDRVAAGGIEPVLGSGGIGMLGYYSGLEIIDSRGLTDAYVARRPLKKRRRPGHEKEAPRGYIIERGVHLLRLRGGQRDFHPERFRAITRIKLPRTRDQWQIAHYDRALMEQLAQVRGFRFTDFDAWLDEYLEELPDPEQVRDDLPWLRSYWFDHNDDPERLARIEARAGPPRHAAGREGEYVVVSVGDLNLAEDVEPLLDERGDAFQFERLRPLLEGDLLVGNLETAVVEEPTSPPLEKSSIHRMAPERLQVLVDEGFDVLSVANNHGMDQQAPGMVEMLDHLDRAGLLHIGGGRDLAGAREAVIVEGGDLRIALLGLYQRTHRKGRLGWYAGRERPGVWGPRRWSLARQVRRLRRDHDVDFVLASMHWGPNYQQENRFQRRFARAMVGAGVDLVNGHGAHLQQGVELVDGVPVLYGIGNAAFGARGMYGKRSGGLRLSSVVRYVFADEQLDRIELRPLATDNRTNGYQPAPVGREIAERWFEPLLERYGVAWTAGEDGWYAIELPQP